MLKYIVVIASSSFAATALADIPDADAENCKDSAILSRFPGCKIQECSNKEFDAIEFQVGKVLAEGGTPKKNLEGKIETVTYVCPGKTSPLELARNAESALKKAGYTMVFVGKDENEYKMVTAQKGAQWVQVRGRPYDADSAYDFSAALVKAMDQQMQANAETWANELAKSGHVAIYGINFASGKATLTPDSEEVLAEVHKLLTQDAKLRLKLEGHTDNVGKSAANTKLSGQRAEAVKAWLVKKGVAKARLEAQGLGDKQPLADNASDEGRGRNRRVELVKL